MRTDPESQAADMPRPDIRAFRNLAAVMLIGLTVAIGALSWLNARSGPRIRYAELTPASAAVPGQQLLLHANRPLDTNTAEFAVRVAPDISYEMSVRGNTLVVNFNRPLDYDTTYTVYIGNLIDSKLHSRSDYRYTFRTPGSSFVYLERNSSEDGTPAPDRIIRRETGRSDQTVLFEAESIKTFKLTKDYLLAVITDDSKLDQLHYMPLDRPDQLKRLEDLPPNVQVNRFDASPGGNLAGMCVSTNVAAENTSQYERFDNTLLLFNLDELTLKKVPGLGEQPADCVDVSFVPYGGSFLTQAIDSTVFLRSANNPGTAIALGQFISLSNFNQRQTKLLVQRGTGPLVLNADSREVTDLPPSAANALRIRFMQASDTYLVTRNRLGLSSADMEQLVLAVDEQGQETEIAKAPLKETMFNYAAASPNDQFVTFEASPAQSPYDQMGNFSRPREVETIMYDMRNKTETARMRGSQLVWR